jgi:DNA modification methylase
VAQILQGDCRLILPTLDAGSVHCVVTSPPYWGLRDYGTATWDGGDPECGHLRPVQPRNDRPKGAFHGGTDEGDYAREPQYKGQCGKCGARRIDAQLGLEPTPEEFVANMVAVFREVRRVLRDDGTVWLNLGDSYAQGGQERPGSSDAAAFTPHDQIRRRPGITKPRVTTLKPKDLVGIPWRTAFALQADGWYLRSDIIWSKPNPMPESVTDRPTKSHEYVFLLSKRERYYFDQEAVREDYSEKTWFYESVMPTKAAGLLGNNNGTGKSTLGVPDYTKHGGRNIRSVWNIATQPYPEAHFATFPEALVVPCIKAGTSERGVCAECGAPWERVVERGNSEHHCRAGCGHIALDSHDYYDGGKYGGFQSTARDTGGWRPSCAHDAPTVPATVLDPFGGSGTVGAVAERLSRRAILIELSPEYVTLAERRTAQVGLGLV